MNLIDTYIISELRKAQLGNRGVLEFMSKISVNHKRCYLSVITIGELQRGVGMIRHHGDTKQANQLADWPGVISNDYKRQNSSCRQRHLVDLGESTNT